MIKIRVVLMLPTLLLLPAATATATATPATEAAAANLDEQLQRLAGPVNKYIKLISEL